MNERIAEHVAELRHQAYRIEALRYAPLSAPRRAQILAAIDRMMRILAEMKDEVNNERHSSNALALRRD